MNNININHYPGLRGKAAQLVAHPLFKRVVIALIVLNAITLGMETSRSLMAAHGALLHDIDHAILGLFVLEVGLRIFAHRAAFFRDAWSLFDLFVVVLGLIPHSGQLSVLRTLRILRVLRLISFVPAMRRVVTGLIASLSGMASVAAIMMVIFYVFSVIAAKLFQDVSPDYFDTLGHSMLTLFQIMTLEDWAVIARPIIAAMPDAWIFFVCYILVSTFTILNLFIGVLVHAIQSVRYEGGERRKLTTEQAAALKLLEEGGLIAELRALREGVEELKNWRTEERKS